MNNWRQLFQILLVEVGIILVLYPYLDSTQKFKSFGIGVVTSFANFFLLWLMWYVILFKKRVAIVLPAVVIKYSILIILLVFWGHKIEHKVFFMIGVLSVPLAIAVYGLGKVVREIKKG